MAGGLIKDGSSLQRDVEGAADGISASAQSLSEILARADRGDSALGVLVTDEERGGVTEDLRGIVQDFSIITSVNIVGGFSVTHRMLQMFGGKH